MDPCYLPIYQLPIYAIPAQSTVSSPTRSFASNCDSDVHPTLFKQITDSIRNGNLCAESCVRCWAVGIGRMVLSEVGLIRSFGLPCPAPFEIRLIRPKLRLLYFVFNLPCYFLLFSRSSDGFHIRWARFVRGQG